MALSFTVAMKRYTLLLASSTTNELVILRGDLVPKGRIKEKKESEKKKKKRKIKERRKIDLFIILEQAPSEQE